MSKFWIDRLGNGQRRGLMLALRMGPSMGAIAVGGGLTTLAIATGMFGLFGAGKYIHEIRLLAAKKTDRELFRCIYGGTTIEGPDWLRQMGRDIAGRFGIEAPVNVFVTNIGRLPAGAIGSSVFFGAAVNAGLTFEEQEFIMAHEIAHIKAGDTSKKTVVATAVMDRIEKSLAIFAAAGLAQVFAQASLPVILTGVGMSSAGLLLARRLVKGYENRSVERCRDSEALQKTGDLQSAISVLTKMTSLRDIVNPPGRLSRLFRTHPPYKERVSNLCRAYFEAVENGNIHPTESRQPTRYIRHVTFERLPLPRKID